MKLLFILLLLTSPLTSLKGNEEVVDPSHRILFLLQGGRESEGFNLYRDYVQKRGGHDFTLLHQIGELYLDIGIASNDLEIQLMAIFGASIANSENSFARLCKGLTSEHLAVQLLSLKGMTHLDTREADEMLKQLMKKGNAIIRLESTYQLALKKYPIAASQAEVFMSLVPDQLLAEFPAIFAAVGDADSVRILKRLIRHSSEEVRAASILSAAKTRRDDFLPLIRSLSLQGGALQQEACAYALGIFNNSSGLPYLKQLAKSPHIYVKLAANKSLASQGDQNAIQAIVEEAYKGSPHATAILAGLPETKEILAKLLVSDTASVRLNAAWGLLEQKDPRSIPIISAILLAREQDLGILEQRSPAKTLTALKTIPSAKENLREDTALLMRSEELMQIALINAVELSENDFHTLADDILKRKQNFLIPTVIELLVNHRSDTSLELLNKYRQTPGAPLLRNYCNLGLYKLNVEGPYAESLKAWILAQKDIEFLNIDEFLEPKFSTESLSTFEITPQESAKLYIEILESFTRTKDDMGVDLIISIIENGHRKNRFALAGLLILATE